MWKPDRPIIELPRSICRLFADDAAVLLADLEESWLCVVLGDAPEPKHSGHKIRLVENMNPPWYRELYHANHHFRRDRSLAALARIMTRKDRPYTCLPYRYDATYRGLIKERLVTGFDDQGCAIPPNKTACAYFGVRVPLEQTVRSTVPF